uniref:F-box domain-containing protein n=1 Tax=Parascaris univalens TaxID=6257 RepID=A0A915AXF9_PARUN
NRNITYINEVMNNFIAEIYDKVEEEKPLSAMEELRLFRAMLVCGELVGKHPPGFLSQFNNLPDHLLLKIWSFMPKREMLSLRRVSKHWKALWELSKHPRYRISHLNVSIKNEKFVMEARGRRRLAGRRLEVGMDTASLNCFFSLITFGRKGGIELSIEGAAATSILFEGILSKRWTFDGVVFMGDLSALTEYDLCLFLFRLCKRCDKELSLRFLDITVDEGIITDRVIEACGYKLSKLVIMLDSECAKKKPVLLTDRSLPFIVREGLEAVIPDMSEITIRSLEKAITDAITGPIKLPSDIDLSEELIVWSESKLVFPNSDNFLISCLAKTGSLALEPFRLV